VSRTRDDKGKRVYTPAQQAKRERKFREHLAKKQNPVRFALALPEDMKLEDVDWNPDHLEKIAERFAEMKARWLKEDDRRRQERLKEILAAVERDKGKA
jgi:hypothetical protein